MAERSEVEGILASVETESGANLLALVEASPVLLVFLRHFGCTFCRKTISDVAELKDELAERGVRPVFVHLGTPEIAKAHFNYYGLGEVERVYDPEARIYQDATFGLLRTNAFSHFFKPKVWMGWLNGGLRKHGFGRIQNDGSQMPGVFFIRDGMIVRRFVHRTIADEVDYRALTV
ncbi:redoxin domain-containing protein [Granulicella sp. 5B5]|uniref:SelL-related redox protein n=1 Tax=Granulicella sp. 5B5 TaxID=1617967 RepID=UPI0015F6950D|nr:SelL-related redox protein [Granulicella sp. 5B5]QMV17836.1 redoxin domain-containing protein [Granulicella sp. 5B5]